jgi:hypothetical protein
MLEGYLIAATEDDQVLPVTEILAVNSGKDSAIVRVKSIYLTALPLGTYIVFHQGIAAVEIRSLMWAK